MITPEERLALLPLKEDEDPTGDLATREAHLFVRIGNAASDLIRKNPTATKWHVRFEHRDAQGTSWHRINEVGMLRRLQVKFPLWSWSSLKHVPVRCDQEAGRNVKTYALSVTVEVCDE